MAKGGNTGPNRGALQTNSFVRLMPTSATSAAAIFSFPEAGRLLAIRVRLANEGTGTATAFKIRRAAAGNTAVTAAGTQVLGADGGAIAANATTSTDIDGAASSAALILAAQRDFATGEQLGVFLTMDGGTTNLAVVDITWFPRAHYTATNEVD